LSDRRKDRLRTTQEDVVIRINRLAFVAAVATAGFAAPVSAQVGYRDRWMEQQEAKIRAELQSLTSQAQRNRMRDEQDRFRDPMRIQQERMRDQMKVQQDRIRQQQSELRERQLERSREQRAREVERAQEMRERMLERSQDQRESALERAQEIRDRAEEARERALERVRDQQINEFPVGRRVYITPPPNVRIKPRWPDQR
jgi:hypothetical protein